MGLITIPFSWSSERWSKKLWGVTFVDVCSFVRLVQVLFWFPIPSVPTPPFEPLVRPKSRGCNFVCSISWKSPYHVCVRTSFVASLSQTSWKAERAFLEQMRFFWLEHGQRLFYQSMDHHHETVVMRGHMDHDGWWCHLHDNLPACLPVCLPTHFWLSRSEASDIHLDSGPMSINGKTQLSFLFGWLTLGQGKQSSYY